METFNIGADVVCQDKTCGKLAQVVVDPYTHRVTDLIVEKGLLFKTDRVLPVSLVERADKHEVRMDVLSDQLAQYPEYREIELEKPAPGWGQSEHYKAENMRCWVGGYNLVCTEPVVPRVRQWIQMGIPGQLAAIGRGTPVWNAQGSIGQVDHVLVEPEQGEITYLVLRRGLIPDYPVLPASMLEDINEERVLVQISEEELKELPRYRPRDDRDILAEWQDRLEELDVGEVKATIENGLMHLSGLVRDVATKRRVEAAARSIEGVIDVDNALDSDMAVRARVSTALLHDPETRMAVIEVISDLGIVTLKGQVDSPTIRERAGEIAIAQEGVLSVVNALEVKADDYTESLGSWPRNIPWATQQYSPLMK